MNLYGLLDAIIGKVNRSVKVDEQILDITLQEQARNNINAASKNDVYKRNLLDNSDFTNPVNQRGQTSYSGAVYGIDRWRGNYWSQGSAFTTTVAIEDGGLRLSGGVADTPNSCAIEQRLTATKLGGKTLTFAALSKEFSSKTTDLVNIFCDSTVVAYGGFNSNGLHITTFTVPEGTELIVVRIGNSASHGGRGVINVLLSWAALYEGSYTAETLPAYQPKGYSTELLNCIQNKADSTDTYANKVVAKTEQLCNPNLLDNWYFLNPVNQRRQTSYTGTGYGINRWRTNFSGDTITIQDNGVKNVNTSTSVGWHLHQIVVDSVSTLIGNTVTAAFLIEDYKGERLKPIISFRNASDGEISALTLGTMKNGVVVLSGKVPSNTAKIRVGLYASSGVASGDYVVMGAAKLELGNTQTLAHLDSDGNWVLNEIPDYHGELLKCIQSTADSADTRANKVVAKTEQLCNPNLLDNWYFGNPVNQRGQTTYSASDYTIDRWSSTASTSIVEINDGGVNYTTATVGQSLNQRFENWENLKGKTLTVSMLVGTGASSRICIIIAGGTSARSSYVSDGLTYVSATIPNDATNVYVAIQNSTTGAARLLAAKLELGGTQTLAHQDADGNWVLNEIPNFAEQLARCQRFYLPVAQTSTQYLTAHFTHSGRCSIITPALPMRVTPSIMTFSGSAQVYVPATGWRNISPFIETAVCSPVQGNAYQVVFDAIDGLTGGNSYIVRNIKALSADL